MSNGLATGEMYVQSGWISLEQWSSLVPGLVWLHICPLVAETRTQVKFVAPWNDRVCVCVCVGVPASDPAVKLAD